MIDDDEIYDLQEEVRVERKYHNELIRHPDCSDPDHPGCDDCWEQDDE